MGLYSHMCGSNYNNEADSAHRVLVVFICGIPYRSGTLADEELKGRGKMKIYVFKLPKFLSVFFKGRLKK